MADLHHAGKIRRVEGSHLLAGTLLGESVSPSARPHTAGRVERESELGNRLKSEG